MSRSAETVILDFGMRGLKAITTFNVASYGDDELRVKGAGSLTSRTHGSKLQCWFASHCGLFGGSSGSEENASTQKVSSFL
jgi:hypothetical protein